ncbi:DNA -binding domain-containing protein [Blastomonas sp. SL216]|uniref:DNA -binding domain-containing protein n=1 Tax=Blastomonas sp. SL216 TaxID=2995169 RepID=UPI0023775C3B|nr:DUF2285 domain-containing protein [Blastomonas sp. SL216]
MIILDAAPDRLRGRSAASLVASLRVIAEQKLRTGHHMVLSDGQMLHRLCLLTGPHGRRLAFVIPCDQLASIRLSASAALDRPPVNFASGEPAGLSAPTEFQRQRLELLRDILDLAVIPDGDRLTSHELACQRIYPGMTIGRGAEWKSSSHRRRTQRLIGEARAMMNSGYRALLAGGEGRQKQSR